jgi:hypothetical protein
MSPDSFQWENDSKYLVKITDHIYPMPTGSQKILNISFNHDVNFYSGGPPCAATIGIPHRED